MGSAAAQVRGVPAHAPDVGPMRACAHVAPQLAAVVDAMVDRLQAEDPRVYGALIPYVARGGKRVRAALALLACGAAGGRHEDAVPAAALVELVHSFTLIHDDIEDGADTRRGAPALHRALGVPVALNCGDALYTLVWKALVDGCGPARQRGRLRRAFAAALKRVVDGQGVELAWIADGRFDVTERDYLAMIGGKTAALLGLACRAGAIAAGPRHGAALAAYGESLGLAFQLRDDVLDLIGDEARLGKTATRDIVEGKRTLAVVHCLQRATGSERDWLIDVLRRPANTPREIDGAIELLHRHGSIAYAMERARQHAQRATRALAALPPSVDRDALAAIADYAIARDT